MGMTRQQIKELYDQGSKSFQQRNPDLVGVGEVETKKSKPTSSQALVGSLSKHKGSKGRVAIRVSLIVLSRRTLDDDNLVGACKPLRDAICESIGIDDGDERIKFEYGQQKTDGQQGVAVKIQGFTNSKGT